MSFKLITLKSSTIGHHVLRYSASLITQFIKATKKYKMYLTFCMKFKYFEVINFFSFQIMNKTLDQLVKGYSISKVNSTHHDRHPKSHTRDQALLQSLMCAVQMIHDIIISSTRKWALNKVNEFFIQSL